MLTKSYTHLPGARDVPVTLSIRCISSENPPLSENTPLFRSAGGGLQKKTTGFVILARIPPCFAPLENKGGILARNTSDDPDKNTNLPLSFQGNYKQLVMRLLENAESCLQFDISHNELEEIPDQIKMIVNVLDFRANNNQIHTIPKSFGQLKAYV